MERIQAVIGEYHNYAFVGTQEMLDLMKEFDPSYNPDYVEIIDLREPTQS